MDESLEGVGRIQVGVDADGPKTTDRVWTAPREVRSAAPVRNANGESEKYLFYRGVGTDRSVRLLRIEREDDRLLLFHFSVPLKLERAMIGRIELVTPEQRETIKRLSSATYPSEAQKLYKSLGRFKQAIVRDELARDKSPMLTTVLAMP